MATMNVASNASSGVLSVKEPAIHPLFVRVTHWINALVILVMIGSGWQIYNASPLFPFTFPPAVTLAGGLLWHFAGIWVLAINGLAYLAYGVLGGRFRRKLLPVYPREVLRDLYAALTGRLAHDDLAIYNAVQRVMYLGVLLAGLVVICSGLAIWKPVQLQGLTALLGGYEAARIVHFFAMAAIVVFTLIHVVMALLVPRSLRAMLRGH